MLRHTRWLLPVILTAVASAAPAGLPSPEVLKSDLETIYSTQPARPRLSHNSDLAAQIEPIFLQQAFYLVPTLRPWEKIPEALLLTDGNSGEHGIRPNAHTAYGLAILGTCVRLPPEEPPAALFASRAVAILRFLLPTHGAGGVPCNDGKLWHNQWQSALWANETGKAAWLLWDELDAEMKWLAARMVCDEADRFLGKTPPTQVRRDTKSEENAWNASVMSLAGNMFPRHPHAARWREEAIRWILNSYGREADLQSDRIFDGKPLREWLAGPVLHDDYSLENHNRVHPDYMGVTRATLIQRMVYDWGGTTVPQALDFNVRQVHDILERLAWPDGGVLYPNGQDWQIHRSPLYLLVHLVHAVFYGDKTAATLARLSLETTSRMETRQPDGGVYLPEEFFFPSTRHYILQMLAESLLVLRGYGDGPKPLDPEQAWKNLSGLHLFPTGGFGVVRTPHSAATFSWGQQIMGMVLPLEPDLLVTPNERGMIGSVLLAGQSKETAPKSLRHGFVGENGTLRTTGVLERAGGRVHQHFAFAALPDGRAVYADRLISRTTEPLDLHLGTVGILNEPQWVYSDGDRTVHYDGGKRTFAATDADSTTPVMLRSGWINMDDKLGIVSLEGGGTPAYVPRTVWKTGRVEQLLHLNYQPRVRASPGRELARNTLVFYPGQNTSETAAAARRCRADTATSDTVSVVLEDGGKVHLTFPQ